MRPEPMGLAVQNLRGLLEVLIGAAGAARNHALIGIEFAVREFYASRLSGLDFSSSCCSRRTST